MTDTEAGRIPVLHPDQTALLVIDMQKAFTDPEYPLCVAGAAQTIPVLQKLIALCRRLGIYVIWIRRIYEKDGSDMEAFRRRDLQKKGCVDIMSEEHPGALPSSGLKEENDEPVVIKKRFSAFFQTDLDQMLKDRGIRTLIVSGTQTPNCIRATVFDGISLDYEVAVVSDATSSASEQVQKANLADMKNAGAEIVNLEELKNLLETGTGIEPDS